MNSILLDNTIFDNKSDNKIFLIDNIIKPKTFLLDDDDDYHDIESENNSVNIDLNCNSIEDIQNNNVNTYTDLNYLENVVLEQQFDLKNQFDQTLSTKYKN